MGSKKITIEFDSEEDAIAALSSWKYQGAFNREKQNFALLEKYFEKYPVDSVRLGAGVLYNCIDQAFEDETEERRLLLKLSCNTATYGNGALPHELTRR